MGSLLPDSVFRASPRWESGPVMTAYTDGDYWKTWPSIANCVTILAENLLLAKETVSLIKAQTAKVLYTLRTPIHLILLDFRASLRPHLPSIQRGQGSPLLASPWNSGKVFGPGFPYR